MITVCLCIPASAFINHNHNPDPNIRCDRVCAIHTQDKNGYSQR